MWINYSEGIGFSEPQLHLSPIESATEEGTGLEQEDV